MHALFSKSEEGDLKGLGLIKGEVKKFKKMISLKFLIWDGIRLTLKNKFDNKNLIENYFFILFIHIM